MPPLSRPRYCLSAVLVFFALPPAAVQAQSFDLQGGGAAVVAPKYEGSKDYEVRGFPIIAPAGESSPGFVQFRGVDDVRFRVIQLQGFEAGPLVGYRFGRDEDDADRLNGLGDVDGGVVVGAYAGYDIGGVKPFVSYHHQVTGDAASGIVRFGAETRFPLSPSLMLTAVAGATYASGDYTDDYFSITAVQAAASTLAIYDADAGIKDVYLGLGADVPISALWSVKLGVRYAHLLGDVADSPIVETDRQFQGLIGLTYRFNVAR